jgi:D-aspartate ligase
MNTEPQAQAASSLPSPLILGSALNAYGLIRSFGEKGVKAIVADSRFGMASASRYVSQKWRLPTDEPTAPTINALFEHAKAFGRPLMLIPTNETWVAAIAHHRHQFDKFFSIPLPSPQISMMAISKDLMHSWCLANRIRVPHTVVFKPGDDWRTFLESARLHLPVIVKPQTKCADEKHEEIGFSTRVFQSMAELEKWGDKFGKLGPSSCTLWQHFLCGPTTNIVAFHGYRAKDGRMFMAGLTKLRIQPPICGGSTSAAYLRADAEATGAAQQLLAKLEYHGFFDIEFMRDERNGNLYFIELNPRPGLPNYGATAVGVNFVWEGYADQAPGCMAGSQVVINSDYLWIRLFTDFVLYVFIYRAMGLGIGPIDWWRSIRNFRLVDTSLNFRDPLVIFAGMVDLGFSAGKRMRRFFRSHIRSLSRERREAPYRT